MVSGVFAILGYRFSPRIADISGARYWRAGWPGDPDGDYGPLNAMARNKVNLAKIVAAGPDMLRVAGSLITHQVCGYDVLAMLGRDGRPTPLGQGFVEYGRIAKTLHLLAMIDPVDDTHRRAVNTQTTVQESLHRLVRRNTRYLDAAVHDLRRHGHPVRTEDVARLSPLGHADLNELARYRFPRLAPGADLRALRDPNAGDEEEP